MIRYGFHGYGNPEDDNGIVVFAGDRLKLEEVVAEIPCRDYSALHDGDLRQFQSIGEVQEWFLRHGSHGAKELAEQVAAAASLRASSTCLTDSNNA